MKDRKEKRDNNAYQTVLSCFALEHVVQASQSCKISEGTAIENHLWQTAPHLLDLSDPKQFHQFVTGILPGLGPGENYTISKQEWKDHLRPWLCRRRLGLSEKECGDAKKKQRPEWLKRAGLNFETDGLILEGNHGPLHIVELKTGQNYDVQKRRCSKS